MDVGMIHEVLSPGVQNTDDAYFCAEMFRVIGECHKRFRNRAKKKIVHDLQIHGDQGIQFCGNGEHHVEVLDRQKVFAAGLDPFFLGQCLAFGTMPVPAGVVRYDQVSAVVALVPVAAQGRCPADLDGVHDPQMITGQLVRFSVNLTVLTENVRNLETAG
jgi:hypothetical protein